MTLKDISAAAGTSVSTVSRVLNQTSPTCASKELQEKIWAIAVAGGYLPDENARSLKKGGRKKNEAQKALQVSIVLARISSLEEEPFFAELFRCLESELLQAHVTLKEVIFAEDSVTSDLKHCDGVIIVGRCTRMLLDRIQKQNKNIVGIWRNAQDFSVDEVICDGKKAAETAMEHLLSLGHKKIAYIGSCSNEQRYVGYCDTMFSHHIPIDYSLIRPTDHTGAKAQAAFYDLMALKERGDSDFTAIFCANDVTAIRVLSLLEENRRFFRKHPISVVSIDDIEEAQNTRPYLTTVRMPKEEMAHMGVLLLLDRIRGGHKEFIRNEFPCRLARRSSTFEVQA